MEVDLRFTLNLSPSVWMFCGSTHRRNGDKFTLADWVDSRLLFPEDSWPFIAVRQVVSSQLQRFGKLLLPHCLAFPTGLVGNKTLLLRHKCYMRISRDWQQDIVKTCCLLASGYGSRRFCEQQRGTGASELEARKEGSYRFVDWQLHQMLMTV